MSKHPVTPKVRAVRVRRLGPRRAVTRFVLSALAGCVAAIALAHNASPSTCAVVGWDTTATVLLAFSWWTIWHASPEATQFRCAGEDPGRSAVYAFAVITSAVSLFAAALIARQSKAITGAEHDLLLLLCFSAVVLSWALTHTLLTLRYAHLYYREDDEGVGGVEFPGDTPPAYFDFAYFAFTIGMCFQVSDTTMTSAQIRRTALGHALLSFAYNTVVVAFTLNLVFGAIG